MIVSTEPNHLVARRAEKLHARCVRGVDDKLAVVRDEAALADVAFDHVAYLGNDVNDAECLAAVGPPVLPADAWPEVIPLGRWILERPPRLTEGVCDGVPVAATAAMRSIAARPRPRIGRAAAAA